MYTAKQTEVSMAVLESNLFNYVCNITTQLLSILELRPFNTRQYVLIFIHTHF